jgi:hypothetical protein
MRLNLDGMTLCRLIEPGDLRHVPEHWFASALPPLATHNDLNASLTSLLDWTDDEPFGGTFGGTTAVMKSTSQEILQVLE